MNNETNKDENKSLREQILKLQIENENLRNQIDRNRPALDHYEESKRPISDMGQ